MYSTYTTAERHGYSVEFSTFEADRLLLATRYFQHHFVLPQQ